MVFHPRGFHSAALPMWATGILIAYGRGPRQEKFKALSTWIPGCNFTSNLSFQRDCPLPSSTVEWSVHFFAPPLFLLPIRSSLEAGRASEGRKVWQSAKSFLTKSAGWGNDSDWHAKGMAHRMQFHSSFLKMKRSIFGSVVKSRSKIFKTKKEVRT